MALFYNNLVFPPPGTPPEPAETPQEVHSFFSSCVEDEEREDSGEVESSGHQLVMQYLSSNPKTRGLSLLGVWKEIMSGALVSVAKKILAIPATSTPSERSFSVAGRLIEERRTNLDPENVDKLLFLHSNI